MFYFGAMMKEVIKFFSSEERLAFEASDIKEGIFIFCSWGISCVKVNIGTKIFAPYSKTALRRP